MCDGVEGLLNVESKYEYVRVVGRKQLILDFRVRLLTTFL
jgi:hypothetical protein